MRVIIQRSRTDNLAFVVVVVLVTDIPIETMIDLDCQPGFRGLEGQRIGSDQAGRSTSRIRNPSSLAVVVIYTILSEKSCPLKSLHRGINEEVAISHVEQTVAEWMLNTVVVILNDRIAVDPVV